ncbi:MAG TPA: hypothetical protein VK669_06565 [Candidatus Limnocylindrales bacterium]|nr:hypothetical protein [Candidatus Limnocylindrales bacterium]
MKRTPSWVFVAAVGVQLAALALCLWAMERGAVAEAVAEEEPPAPPAPPQASEAPVHRDALAAAQPVVAPDAAHVREPERETEAVRPVQPPEPPETAEAPDRPRVTVRAVDVPPQRPEPEPPRAEEPPRWESPRHEPPQYEPAPYEPASFEMPKPRPAVVRVPPPSPVFGPPPERQHGANGADLLPAFITDPADEVTQIVRGVARDGRLAFGFYGDGIIRFVDTDGGLYEGKADSARARMREIDGIRAFTVQIGVAEDRRLLATFSGGPHDAESIPLEPAVGWSVA